MHNWKRILQQQLLHERLPQHEETAERIFKYRTLVCTGTHKVQGEKIILLFIGYTQFSYNVF